MAGMRAVKSLMLAVLVFVVLAAPSVALADGRGAGGGNSTYAHIGRMPNPDNDARDISAALRRLEFEVTIELDADRVEIIRDLCTNRRKRSEIPVFLTGTVVRAGQIRSEIASWEQKRLAETAGRNDWYRFICGGHRQAAAALF